MPKKKYNNYDNTLFGRYIRQIENPDSIGWDSSSRIWRQSTRKGDDERNRGMGIDVLNNKAAKKLTQGRVGGFLTEEEERQLRNEYLQEMLNVIDRQKAKHPGLNNMSPRKQAEVIGALYRGDAPKLWDKSTILGKALESPNEEDFHRAIDTYYNSISLGERARNNDKFWSNQTHSNQSPHVPSLTITRQIDGMVFPTMPSSQPTITKQDVVDAAMLGPKAVAAGVGTVASYINQAVQKYVKPKENKDDKTVRWAEGGFLKPKDAWDALSMKDKADMIGIAVKHGITTLSDIRDKYNEFAEGGDLYDVGGYAPSESIKKRISRWEGDAMVKDTIDPLSGKMAKKNTPFEEVTRGFVRAIPSEIREQVFSNPELADNLYSYAYNVGPGNFKKRVIPVLEKFYNGDATVDDVTSSMWASGDKKLRGLRNRRAEEKAGVRNALLGYATTSTVLEPTTPALVATNNYVSSLYPLLTEEVQPTPLFYRIEDRSTDISPSPEELERQERREALDRFNTVMSLIGIKNPLVSYTSNTGNSFLDTLGLSTNKNAGGGKIHIKPSHRGRLTELKKRTGKTEAELYRTGSPATRKMISFARNARKWKHGDGGNLFEEGGKPNIFMRPDGTYFYQAFPGSEEVTVTPQTTIFDNPALWTYVDKEGKRYTPKETPIPEQGTITEHVSHGPIVDAVNNYYREGIYRANNGTLALRGKYMLPLAGIAATGIGTAIEAPFATAMSIAEGTIGGLATDMLSNGLSGNRWATNMSNWTGLDKPIAELTNPGLLIGGQAGYSGGRTIARGVAQDKILASEHTPKMAELYSKIYKGDISELQNQTPWRALTKGSPNLGNEYGIFDKNNPLWNPRRDKTAFISELANYTLPFAGPIKTAARWPLANYMSESASPERILDDVFSLRDVGTMLKPFIKRGKYNGLVDSELGFPTDVEKEYPGINFLNYYLWKNDPLLKLTPSVKTTASYFRENPAPFKTSFGERYNLYGDVSQGRMPVKSAETLDKEIAKELASKHPIPQIRTKDLDGITKEGIENSEKLYRLTHDEAPLEVNKWIGIEEPFNPDLPELNIAGHQMFLDSNNGTLLSRDIWKFNPWDWRVKWGEHGGSAAQAGILDKLGTPFITTSKNNLNKDALLYLKSK